MSETELKIPEEGKSGKKKTVLVIAAAALALAVLCSGVTAVLNTVSLSAGMEKARSCQSVNTKPDFENISDGVWNIKAQDGLRVVQLTDIDLGGGWMSRKKDAMALNAVASMLSAERPDLVIVTGNIVYSSPLKTGTFNNRSGAGLFAGLMEQLGIYWTFCCGDRDTGSLTYFGWDSVTDFYSSGEYPHCLFQRGPEEAGGYGSQVFRLVNRDGVITRALVLMDSGNDESRVQWYKDTAEAMRAENVSRVTVLGNAKTLAYIDEIRRVPVSLFLHAPLAEYGEAWEEYKGNGYKDTENAKLIYGTAGEEISRGDSGLFGALLSSGAADTVFCGKDTLNWFSMEYKGIGLTYGMSVDYLSGKGMDRLGSQRGCTVITFGSGGEIGRRAENYYQDKYETPYPKEDVTMQNEKGE